MFTSRPRPQARRRQATFDDEVVAEESLPVRAPAASVSVTSADNKDDDGDDDDGPIFVSRKQQRLATGSSKPTSGLSSSSTANTRRVAASVLANEDEDTSGAMSLKATSAPKKRNIAAISAAADSEVDSQTPCLPSFFAAFC